MIYNDVCGPSYFHQRYLLGIASCVIHDLGVDWSDQLASPPPTFCREGISQGMSGTRIDMVLATPDAVACLPRTVRIGEGEN